MEQVLRVAISYRTSKTNQFGARSRKELLAANRGTWELVILQVLFKWNLVSGAREDDQFFSRLFGPDNGYNRLNLQSRKVAEALKDIALNMPGAPADIEKRYSPISLKKTAITWYKAAAVSQADILRIADHRTSSSSQHYQHHVGVCNAFDVMEYTTFSEDQLEILNATQPTNTGGTIGTKRKRS